MFRQRILATIILLPLGMGAIYRGGWVYTALIALLLGIATWEYGRLFQASGFQPANGLMVAGSLALVLARAVETPTQAIWYRDLSWVNGLIPLALMIHHLVQYERGRDQAATDFAISLSGVFYIGLLGSYLIALRQLPEGVWWVLVVLPAVWLADSGAYFIGRAYGRHRLSPRLSPKKSWEGYFAGIVTGVLGGAAFAALWSLPAGPQTAITPLRGALLGLILAALTPLGDLGESMVKRQAGVKDSSHLIPGHGGAFDRIDSWLWAGFLGYYLTLWFFI